MKVYFIRHGHPDYDHDCLTELGHRQAAAAAERLKNSGIEKVYSSPRGRAMETAEHTAKALGLEVIPTKFMQEIGWSSATGEPILENGHPWLLADHFASQGDSLLSREWETQEPYCKSHVINCYKTVVKGLDEWLLGFGYRREGDYYRLLREPVHQTVAMFSHGGSSSVAMAHLFNIPFPQFCGTFRHGFTSVSVVEFSNAVGELFNPKMHLFNDVRHTEGLETKNVFGM